MGNMTNRLHQDDFTQPLFIRLQINTFVDNQRLITA